MIENLKELERVANEIKEKINNYSGYIKIITHHDTDGLSSGGIVAKTLLRNNKLFHISVVEHLSDKVIEKLHPNCLYIFCDMGSGQLDKILQKDENINAIILDHHPPSIYEEKINNIIQLNPHLYGIDGSKEATASSICYLLARAYNFYDLAGLAIVGMIGDMQYNPFLGLNKFIVNEAREHKIIKIFKDIIYNVYGVELYKAIAYCTKPYIETLSSENKAYKFLNELKINPEKTEMDESEKKRFLAQIAFKFPDIDKLMIDRIIINHKVQDAFLLSEILNSVGRFGKFGVGIGITLEDDKCIEIGKELLWKYKKELVSEIKRITLKDLKHIKYFEGKKGYIGVIASILATEKPVVGYYIEDDIAKFSARGNKELVERGLDLNKVMAIAKEFSGNGGGHNIAAGATIKKEYIQDFLKRIDELVGEQLKGEKK